MDRLNCRMKEYIQPFERRLALQELRALAGGPVVPVDGDDDTASTFAVARTNDAGVLRRALAYRHSIGGGADGLTTQLRGEATLGVARNGAANGALAETGRAQVPLKLPNKRCLRYATHGLHEYRGKFFPQLVRALMNIARLPKDGVRAPDRDASELLPGLPEQHPAPCLLAEGRRSAGPQGEDGVGGGGYHRPFP